MTNVSEKFIVNHVVSGPDRRPKRAKKCNLTNGFDKGPPPVGDELVPRPVSTDTKPGSTDDTEG